MFPRRLEGTLLALSLAFALALPAGAQNNPKDRPATPQKSGEIRGEVDYCGPGGATGVMVYIAGESLFARLGATGTFVLRYVPPGTYTLTIEIPGTPRETVAGVTSADNTVTDLGAIAICRDSDGDGAQEDLDCNDNNAAVHPGAVELCNGVDDDCDGVVDEGCAACTDSDGDGFFAQSGCLTAVDCDDSDPLIRPNATEVCDEQDNNCDGQSDEGFDLDLDPANCGSCGNVCSFDNAAALCSLGECQMGACEQGFDDCDMAAANGCEIDVAVDTVNCGFCGNICSGGEPPACTAPADCQGVRGDPACVGGGCTTFTTDDDSACDASVEVSCAPYQSVFCTGEVEQSGPPPCPTVCTNDAECVEGFYCSPDQLCLAKLPSGAACITPNQCLSGDCVVTGGSAGTCL